MNEKLKYMFTQNLDHSICNSIISNTQKTETAQMSVILQCTGITVVIIVQSRGNTEKHWLGYFKLVNFMVCNLYLDVKGETKSFRKCRYDRTSFPSYPGLRPSTPRAGVEWASWRRTTLQHHPTQLQLQGVPSLGHKSFLLRTEDLTRLLVPILS